MGEVINTLQSNIRFVQIVATFYNAQNIVVGTNFTFTMLDILKPGQKSPFELSSYPDKISPASYKLSVSYLETEEEPFTGLAILSHTASFDSLEYHRIVGEVRNNGIRKSTFVMLICTYYDSIGNVMGTSFTFTNPEEIEAGDAAPFELSSYPRELHPHHYELQVQGR